MEAETNNDFDLFLNFIDKDDSPLAIYGTGEAARIIYDCLTRALNKRVDFFVDKYKTGKYYGVNILKIENITANTRVIIAANPLYKIENRLISRGIRKYMYFDPEILLSYCADKNFFSYNEELIDKNKDKIEDVKSLVNDDISVAVFENVLKQRVNPCVKEILSFYTEGQYFGNDLIKTIDTGIVDCGSYTGDTLKRFVSQRIGDDLWKYFAFEVDEENCKIIKDYILSEGFSRNVNLFNCAVWEKKSILNLTNSTMSNEKNSGTVMGEGGKEVLADSLDNILKNSYDDIKLITMDIEGAELNALIGAQEIIRTRMPMLAISIYHRTEHIYEIPMLIHEICPVYKLYIRHHRWNISDTVCYAIV